MSTITVLVSVRDNYHDRLPEVVQTLEAAGMTVEQCLVELGIIVGAIAPDRMEQIAQLAGVAAVEPETGYQLAPPESGIQSDDSF